MTAQNEFSRIEQFIRNALKDSSDNPIKVVDLARDEVKKNVDLIRPMLISVTRKESERRELIERIGNRLRLRTLEELSVSEDRHNFTIVELDDGSAWKFLDTHEAERYAPAIEKHRVAQEDEHSKEIIVNLATYESTRLFCLRCGIEIFRGRI